MRIDKFFEELMKKPDDIRQEFVVCSRHIDYGIFRMSCIGFTADEIECFVKHALKTVRETQRQLERIKGEQR